MTENARVFLVNRERKIGNFAKKEGGFYNKMSKSTCKIGKSGL